MALWNLLLTIFSFCGTIRTVPHLFYFLETRSFRETLCLRARADDIEGVLGLWATLFVFSKVAELIDTVFIVLHKKKLLFLHWYHHTTVLLMAWYAYISQSSTELYFMAMNYSVHSVMYGYYFLKSIDKWPRWLSPQFITIAQISQMVLGSFVCFMNCFYWLDGKPCFIEISSIVPAGIVYTTYFYLFVKIFVDRFIRVKSKTN
jgi:hypothetical protein